MYAVVEETAIVGEEDFLLETVEEVEVLQEVEEGEEVVVEVEEANLEVAKEVVKVLPVVEV